MVVTARRSGRRIGRGPRGLPQLTVSKIDWLSGLLNRYRFDSAGAIVVDAPMSAITSKPRTGPFSPAPR